MTEIQHPRTSRVNVELGGRGGSLSLRKQWRTVFTCEICSDNSSLRTVPGNYFASREVLERRHETRPVAALGRRHETRPVAALGQDLASTKAEDTRISPFNISVGAGAPGFLGESDQDWSSRTSILHLGRPHSFPNGSNINRAIGLPDQSGNNL